MLVFHSIMFLLLIRNAFAAPSMGRITTGTSGTDNIFNSGNPLGNQKDLDHMDQRAKDEFSIKGAQVLQ